MGYYDLEFGTLNSFARLLTKISLNRVLDPMPLLSRKGALAWDAQPYRL